MKVYKENKLNFSKIKVFNANPQKKVFRHRVTQTDTEFYRNHFLKQHDFEIITSQITKDTLEKV